MFTFYTKPNSGLICLYTQHTELLCRFLQEPTHGQDSSSVEFSKGEKPGWEGAPPLDVLDFYLVLQLVNINPSVHVSLATDVTSKHMCFLWHRKATDAKHYTLHGCYVGAEQSGQLILRFSAVFLLAIYVLLSNSYVLQFFTHLLPSTYVISFLVLEPL